MRPIDPNMTARLSPLRRYLRAAAGVAAITAALIVGWAFALSDVLSSLVTGSGLAPVMTVILALGGIIAARAGLSWVSATLAARAATDAKAHLRRDVAAALARRDRTNPPGDTGQTITLMTRGVDAIDAYFTGYLPQLTLAATIPLTILVVFAWNDLASFVVVLFTVPLIPIFGILVGWHTQAKTERQWRTLSRLGGHFLDVISGLSTLRIFGRAAATANNVRTVADGYRRATMETLRVAFLSALVLELVATLSVALIAVPIGLQLLDGDLDLRTAFLLLLLAPEIYLPLRAMGTQFHAATEGLAAVTDAFAVVDRSPLPDGDETAPSKEVPMSHLTHVIAFSDVTVSYPGRAKPALDGASAVVRPGEIIALVGPSGAGKTTLLNLLLGFAPVAGGRVTAFGTDIAAIDADRWLRRIAWVPQRPHLFAMSVADNVRLGQPDASAFAVNAALSDAHANFVADLPHGVDTMLGDAGFGLSTGQARRIALARAFLRIRELDCQIVLLDEPTASLDRASEVAVAEATKKLLKGRTALVVAHRPALLDQADRIWHVEDGRVIEHETVSP